MASPAVQTATENLGSSATPTILEPSGASSGDLLTAVIGSADAGTAITGLTGWTQKGEGDDGQGNRYWYGEIIRGASAPDLVAAAANARWVAMCTRVSGHDATTPTGSDHATATGSSVNPDPPNVDPGVSRDHLAITAVIQEGKNDNRFTDTTPSGYTEHADIGSTGGGAGGVHIGGAMNSRQYTGQAENPGAYTSSRNDGWIAITIIVRPGGITEQRTFTGVISSGNLTGDLNKEPQVGMEGIIPNTSLIGALTKEAQVTFEGVDTPTGATTKEVQKKDYVGADTPTGALTKIPGVTFEGADTPTGALALAKTIALAAAGVIATITGALIKQAQIVRSGADTPTGALIKEAQVTFEGSDTPTGALAVTRLFFESMAGVISTITGALALRARKQMAGVDSPTGTLNKEAQVTFEGADTPVGDLTKEAQVTFEGTIATITGALSNIKKVLISMAGTLTSAGALIKQAQIVRTGADTPTGALTKEAQVTFEGSDTPTGALATARTLARAMAGAISPTGDLIKLVGHRMVGAINPTGVMFKSVSVSMAGVIVSSGVVFKKVLKTFVGVMTSAGSLATRVIIGTLAEVMRTFKGARETGFSKKHPDDFSGSSEDSFDGEVL